MAIQVSSFPKRRYLYGQADVTQGQRETCDFKKEHLETGLDASVWGKKKKKKRTIDAY